MNSSGDGISTGEASIIADLGAVAGGVRGVVSEFAVSGTAMIPTAVGIATLSRVGLLPEGFSIVVPDTAATLGRSPHSIETSIVFFSSSTRAGAAVVVFLSAATTVVISTSSFDESLPHFLPCGSLLSDACDEAA